MKIKAIITLHANGKATPLAALWIWRTTKRSALYRRGFAESEEQETASSSTCTAGSKPQHKAAPTIEDIVDAIAGFGSSQGLRQKR
jgi:hypothetical protein